MTDSHGSLWKGVKDTAAENFTDKTGVLMGNEHPVIVDHDTAAFLSTMLQGIEAGVYNAGNVLRLSCHNAEYTAFFMDTHNSTRYFSKQISKGPIQLPCLQTSVTPGRRCVNS
jgi:hypothetical protein